MQILEVIAQTIWPLLSRFVDKPVRCHTCILTEQAARIDSSGICEQCQTTTTVDSVLSNRAPLKIYEQKALVMISGGKDSAYLLDQLVHDYPVIDFTAIIVDNGFMAPAAKNNAIHLCKLLNVPLIIDDRHTHVFYEQFRNALINLNKKPCYQALDGVDGDITFKLVSDYAVENGFKTIITGLSKEQLRRIFNTDDYVYTDANKIKIVNPLALWNTNESEIRRYVVDNGLMKKAGPLATNSQLVILMAILDTKNLGYSSFEPEFASLVRQGKADRQYWINMFDFLKWSTDRGYFDSIANRLLKRFNLSLKDVT